MVRIWLSLTKIKVDDIFGEHITTNTSTGEIWWRWDHDLEMPEVLEGF